MISFSSLIQTSGIRCEIVAFDHKNEEHLSVLKEQGGIFLGGMGMKLNYPIVKDWAFVDNEYLLKHNQ